MKCFNWSHMHITALQSLSCFSPHCTHDNNSINGGGTRKKSFIILKCRNCSYIFDREPKTKHIQRQMMPKLHHNMCIHYFESYLKTITIIFNVHHENEWNLLSCWKCHTIKCLAHLIGQHKTKQQLIFLPAMPANVCCVKNLAVFPTACGF